MPNFETAIKNLSEEVKKRIVEGFIDLNDEEMRESTFDNLMEGITKGFDKKSERKLNFSSGTIKKIDELIKMLYENFDYPTNEMDFEKIGHEKKYNLLRSIYTIIQMEKPLLGRPYIKCHKCGGKIMTKDNDPYSLPMCQGCGLIMDYDDSLIKL